MLSGNDLPSQTTFSFLSVPEWQHAACAQDAVMDHDAFSRCGSAKKHKAAKADPDAYVPVNYICPEVHALLLAAEASAARRAEVLDAEGMEQDMKGHVGMLQDVLDGRQDPALAVPRMAPPKRFFRTFWRSITHRLLHQLAQA
jgi:hypothetical protein